MIPLLMAAALAVSNPSPSPLAVAPIVKTVPLGSLTPQQIEKLPPSTRWKLSFSGQLCQKRTVQTSGPDHADLKKLGDLPPGLLEHAVNRMVNGCPVREIVYGGQTYYLDMPNPTVERVDPAANVTKAPPKER